MLDIFKTIDNLFDSTWYNNRIGTDTMYKNYCIGYSYYDNDNLNIVLPGIGKENINIEESNDTLTIKFKVKNGKNETESTMQYKLNGLKIHNAEYKDGILIIKFNKSDNKKTIKIS